MDGGLEEVYLLTSTKFFAPFIYAAFTIQNWNYLCRDCSDKCEIGMKANNLLLVNK